MMDVHQNFILLSGEYESVSKLTLVNIRLAAFSVFNFNLFYSEIVSILCIINIVIARAVNKILYFLKQASTEER